MRNIYSKGLFNIYSRNLFMSDAEREASDVVNDAEGTCDLSLFVRKKNIFSVFHEETYTAERGNRSYFCVYFDTHTSNFYTLMYITENTVEAGGAVPLSKLKKNSRITNSGADFVKFKRDTNSKFYTLPFFYENLEAMHQLFGDKPLKKTLSSLYHILRRMIHEPVVLRDNNGEHRTVYSGNTLFQPFHYEKDGYQTALFNVPIIPNISTATDVLGKYDSLNVGIHSTPITISKNRIVLFENVNFIETAKTLLKQYKLTHRISDWFSDLRSQFKKKLSI